VGRKRGELRRRRREKGRRRRIRRRYRGISLIRRRIGEKK
jgi:hypothetical protein